MANTPVPRNDNAQRLYFARAGFLDVRFFAAFVAARFGFAAVLRLLVLLLLVLLVLRLPVALLVLLFAGVPRLRVPPAADGFAFGVVPFGFVAFGVFDLAPPNGGRACAFSIQVRAGVIKNISRRRHLKLPGVK